jgi:hypothetical protein
MRALSALTRAVEALVVLFAVVVLVVSFVFMS